MHFSQSETLNFQNFPWFIYSLCTRRADCLGSLENLEIWSGYLRFEKLAWPGYPQHEIQVVPPPPGTGVNMLEVMDDTVKGGRAPTQELFTVILCGPDFAVC